MRHQPTPYPPTMRTRRLALDAPADTRRVRAAVQAATTVLGVAHLADDAKLVATELVTNALTCPVALTIALTHADDDTKTAPAQATGRALLIAVEDTDPQQLPAPPPGHDDHTGESGRGLAIVCALSTTHGCTTTSTTKTVWATLSTADTNPPAANCPAWTTAAPSGRQPALTAA